MTAENADSLVSPVCEGGAHGRCDGNAYPFCMCPCHRGENADSLDDAVPVRDQIAGLLSTIEFRPAAEHPERMREWADRVLAVLNNDE